MAKPIGHRGKWRIRWIDADGSRREVFEDYADATRALRARQTNDDFLVSIETLDDVAFETTAGA
jgi:hypothetical protein